MERLPDSIASALAAAARNRIAMAREQLGRLPRAGASISNEDAAQLIMSLYQVLLEELEARGDEQRRVFLEDVIGSAITAALPLEVAIKGVSRSYLVFCADVIPDLPPEARGPAGIWFAEYASSFLVEVAQAYGRAHGNR